MINFIPYFKKVLQIIFGLQRYPCFVVTKGQVIQWQPNSNYILQSWTFVIFDKQSSRSGPKETLPFLKRSCLHCSKKAYCVCATPADQDERVRSNPIWHPQAWDCFMFFWPLFVMKLKFFYPTWASSSLRRNISSIYLYYYHQ